MMAYSMPENVLLSQFEKMPGWVRIVTYFVMLVVFVYSVLSPNVLTGEVQEKQPNGSYIGGVASVGLIVNGHDYRTESNEEGTWALPLANRIPETIELKIRAKTERGYSKIEVCWNEVMLGKHIRIDVRQKDGRSFFSRIDQGCQPSGEDINAEANDIAQIFARTVLSAAWAETGLAVTVSIENPEELQARFDANQLLFPIQGDINASVKRLTSDLGITIDPNTLRSIAAEAEPDQALIRYVYDQKTKDATESVYFYYGELQNDDGWTNRYFDLGTGKTEAYPIQGDLIRANAMVNMRSRYIQKTLFGWKNSESKGATKPGELYVVSERKTFGNHLWVKAVPVTEESHENERP